ncbi:MAG: class I SAM-dependent methyltransferase [Bacteroidota bacterium]
MIEAFQRLVVFVVKRRIRRALQEHSLADNAAVNALARSLDSINRGQFSDEENSWVARIEGLRTTLGASREAIQLEDFGAGTSGTLVKGHLPGATSVKTIGDICRTSAVSRMWGTFLFQLIRHTRPSVCLELGTSLGISASYLGAACAVNGNGTVVTLERATAIAGLAEKNFASLHLDMITVVPGQFQNTLESVLKKHRPIDLAFIDGHHDRDATLRYFDLIKRHLSDRAIIVFDDILWSRGMRQAWKEIRRNAGSSVTLDLIRMGVYLEESPQE